MKWTCTLVYFSNDIHLSLHSLVIIKNLLANDEGGEEEKEGNWRASCYTPEGLPGKWSHNSSCGSSRYFPFTEQNQKKSHQQQAHPWSSARLMNGPRTAIITSTTAGHQKTKTKKPQNEQSIQWHILGTRWKKTMARLINFTNARQRKPNHRSTPLTDYPQRTVKKKKGEKREQSALLASLTWGMGVGRWGGKKSHSIPAASPRTMSQQR